MFAARPGAPAAPCRNLAGLTRPEGERIIQREMGQCRFPPFCGIVLAAVAACVPALGSDNPLGARPAPQPRALVLVESMGQGVDQVSLQFMGQVPASEVRRLVAEAARHGGWQPGPQRIEHHEFVSSRLWEQLSGEKAKPQRRTLSRFEVVGLVNRQSGRLAVQEFLRALEGYLPARVVYKVRGVFRFAAPQVRDLGAWRVELHKGEQTYTYDAVRKAGGRSRQGEKPGQRRGSKATRSVAVWLSTGVVAAAVGAGAFCWLGRGMNKKRRRGDSSGRRS